ncbi:DUF805 domain-containing protein [Aurantiacibacter poecillastricola]|uniref:DUF805 domain-containing protein n=1 Tax=Aurantiacibacter poecillastricola TaxID=3064385 RepID=UPI00273F1AF8|nr:DUF805 domain-containing protein [Aurantiacibacter sp. 219JJ12-13]MDP5262951.1 DUF805 domain-containing protein [Aurantiacibacter sp. 219JJ12-13]
MSKSPIHWMVEPLRRYADFRGRSRRAEFWWWMLGYFLVTAVLWAIIFSGFPWDVVNAEPGSAEMPDPEGGPFALFGIGTWIGGIAYFIFWAATVIPNLAVTVRRLHDRGMSGWWYGGLLIANFIPLLNIFTIFGFLALFVICALPGEAAENRWGLDPKGAGQAAVFE